MLRSRHTTQDASYNRTGLALGAGLLLTIIGGCSRNSAPVATQPLAPEIATQSDTPAPTKTSTTKPAPRAKHIVWEKSFEAALAKAKSSGKPVMIDVYAVWCGPCKILDQEIYTAREVIDESANFINVKVDGEKRPDLMRRYNLTGFPSIILADGNGKVIEIMPGAPAVEQFVEFMRSGLSKHMVATVTT